MDFHSILTDYDKHHCLRLRNELDEFRQKPSLEVAIRHAVHSRNEKGKRYQHQCRIARILYFEAEKVLVPLAASLERCLTFADLYEYVEEALDSIAGLNDLYYYDVALRIGAKLGRLPDLVYLHRGSLRGAKVLLGFRGKPTTIAPEQFPPPLCEQPAYVLEDILCIYERVFATGNFDESLVSRGCDGRLVRRK